MKIRSISFFIFFVSLMSCGLRKTAPGNTKPLAKPSSKGNGYTYATRPKYHVDLNYLGVLDSANLEPEDYIIHNNFYKQLQNLIISRRDSFKFQSSGYMLLSFELDSNKEMRFVKILQGLNPAEDSIVQVFAKRIKFIGYSSNIQLEIPVYINIENRKSVGGDTVDVNYRKGKYVNGAFHPDQEDDYIVTRVKVWAMFPGGRNAMNKYIYENIVIPRDMVKKRDKVNLLITFEIDRRGDVVAVFPSSEKDSAYYNVLMFWEISRVLRRMPRWIPGQDNNKLFNTYHRLQVRCYKE